MSEIKSELGLDASAALQTLANLDKAFATLESRLQSTATAFRDFNKSSGAASTAVKKFGDNTSSAMKTVATQTSSSMATANNAVGRFTTSLQLLSRIVFTQFIVRGMSQIRNATSDAARSFVEFEGTLADIRSIDPSANLAALAKSSQQLSNDLNIPLLEVAKSRLELVSAGFQDSADQQRIFASAAKLAKVGVASQTQAVDLLSTSLNAFGASAGESERFARSFFSAVDKGKLNIGELSASFGKVAPQAKNLGVELEEVLALFSTLTTKGSSASESSTQIGALLSSLIKPSEEMQRVIQSLGATSGQELIKLKGFSGALQAIIKSAGGSADALGKIFPNVRAIRGAMSLANDQFATFENHLKSSRELAQQDFDARFLQRMGADSELATKAINELRNAVTIGLGGGITKTVANLARLTGGIENLGIIVEKTFSVITGHAVEELHNAFINRGLAAVKKVEDGLAKALIAEEKVAAKALEIAKSFGITEEAAKRLGLEINQAFSLEKARAFQKQNEAILADLRAELPGGGGVQDAFASALGDLEKLNRLSSVTDDQLRAVLQQFQAIQAQTSDNGFFGQNLIQNQEFDVALAKVNEAFKNILSRRAELAKVPETDFGQAETTAEKLRESTEKYSGNAKDAAEHLLKTIQPSDQLKAAMQSTAGTAQAVAQAAQQTATSYANAANAAKSLTTAQSIGRSITAGDLMPRVVQAGEKPLEPGQQPLQPAAAQQLQVAMQNTAIPAKQIQESMAQVVLPVTQFKDGMTRSAAPAQTLSTAMATMTGAADQASFAIQSINFGLQSAAQQARFAVDFLNLGAQSGQQLTIAIQTASSRTQALVAGAQAAAAAFAAMAQAAERAAQAAAQAASAGAQKKAFGGIMRLAAGGFASQGTDVIPAMLSPGEFVVNAKSTRQFYSQLQAINAGQSPIYRAEGGPVDNSVGEVNINVNGAGNPAAVGRTVMKEIRRELRRGTGSLQ